MAQSQNLHPIQTLQWETADRIVKAWQRYVARMQDLERATHWYFITEKKIMMFQIPLNRRYADTFTNGQLIASYVPLFSILWVCACAGQSINYDLCYEVDVWED